MFRVEVIGHLGADVVIKGENGKQFAACRIAHPEKYKDAQGVEHISTLWVDVIINAESKILPFLLTGTQVFVRGTASLRVYSSAKDKCMKAGLTVRATEIQLLSSKPRDNEQKEQNTGATATTAQDHSYNTPF